MPRRLSPANLLLTLRSRDTPLPVPIHSMEPFYLPSLNLPSQLKSDWRRNHVEGDWKALAKWQRCRHATGRTKAVIRPRRSNYEAPHHELRPVIGTDTIAPKSDRQTC